ncbi:MAG: outer membrane beta-barrel protein [Bacteroidia bacterium]
MNKFILFIAVICFTSFSFSQNLGGGWVVGANISQVDGDAQAGYNQVGLSTGAYVQFQLTDWLQVQPEMLYDQLGARSKDGFLNTRFNYISFPAMVNATVSIDFGDNIRDLNLQAGPVFGVLMSAKDGLNNIPQTDSYRRLDIRYAAGATFELSSDVIFAARIHYSARSIAKGVLPGFGSGPYHNYVHFSIRWNFVRQ